MPLNRMGSVNEIPNYYRNWNQSQKQIESCAEHDRKRKEMCRILSEKWEQKRIEQKQNKTKTK